LPWDVEIVEAGDAAPPDVKITEDAAPEAAIN